jgi:hypothetical protein
MKFWRLICFGCWGVVSAVAFPVGAAVNPTLPPDTFYVAGSTRKICQLVGDVDFQWGTPVENLTQTRAGFYGTDMGVPFAHDGATCVVFGDTWGGLPGDRDAIAFSTDTDPEDGIALSFHTDGAVFHPITIPGVSHGSFNVPLDGVSVSNRMYLYYATDHSASVPMGRSVVAVSTNRGWDFRLLYTFSRTNFINVSVNKVNVVDWPGFPQTSGDGLVIFGSGSYRASNVRLAFQPAADIESRSALRFFTGLDANGNPAWSTQESDSIDLFSQPVVGELSVAYNKFIRRWVMLYNSDDGSRGINFRTALQPWGPWSANQVLLEPWKDGAYGQYFHVHWNWFVVDNVHNAGRDYEFGGEYGPYMFKELATGSDNRTTIYFTMSSWNPYVSLLMKTDLRVTNAPVIVRPPRDQKVMAGESATFELTASAIGTIDYLWTRNGSVLPDATNRTLVLKNPSLAENGAQFRCRVANSSGAVTSSPAYLTVVSANRAPVPQILSPRAGDSYSAGETVCFSGAASDPEDGALPASALSWNVLFCHSNHTVPFLGTLSCVSSGSFTVPVRGEADANVFFRICLTAQDSGGRESTVFQDVLPRGSSVLLQTMPPGLSLLLNGQPLRTPTNLTGVADAIWSLGVPGPTNIGGRDYDFIMWSDQGAPSHLLTLPRTNLSLTAQFRSPTVLIPTNAAWKYLVTGSDPASTWKMPDFNDQSWPSGRAQLGYGDGDESTLVGWGPDSARRYVTTYFRRSFHVANPSVFASLLLRLLRDDGGVVYLNGQEVFRSNIGGGRPLFQMLAPSAANGVSENAFYSTNLAPALLVDGTNVIAVELHQNATDSNADLSFALELRGVEFDPLLSVDRAEGSLLVAWPAPSSGYILEASPALAENPNWSAVNVPAVTTNGENRVMLPVSDGVQFFRLRKP